MDFATMPKNSVGKSYESNDPRVVYAAQHSLREHPAHAELHRETLRHFPVESRMTGAPEVIQLFGNILRAIGGKKFIDVGTFTGYSSVGAALAMSDDGKVIACEVNAKYIEFGIPFWKKAGVEGKIDVNLRPALETLDQLIADGQEGTFDMAFLDADKENYNNYFERCLRLIRSGGVVCIDNVLWDGWVIDPAHNESSTIAIRALNEKLKSDDRINISFLTTGDGFTLAFKK